MCVAPTERGIGTRPCRTLGVVVPYLSADVPRLGAGRIRVPKYDARRHAVLLHRRILCPGQSGELLLSLWASTFGLASEPLPDRTSVTSARWWSCRPSGTARRGRLGRTYGGAGTEVDGDEPLGARGLSLIK